MNTLRRPRMLLGHRLGAAVLVVGVLVSTLLVPARPGGGQEQPSDPEPRVVLVAQRPVVSPGDTLDLSVRVSDAPPDAELSFTMYPALAGRERLDDSIRGARLGRPLRRIDRLPVAVFAGPDGTVPASFPIDDREQPPLGFRLSRAGVYPLDVVLSTPDGATLDRFVTHVVRLPRADGGGATATMGVHVLVPVQAPLSTTPDGTQQLPEAEATRLSELAAMLATPGRVGVTLAVNPETIDALAATPGTETALADLRAATADLPTLAATYVPVDLGSWFEARLGRDLADQFRAGQETLRRQLEVDAPLTDLALADDSTGAIGLDGLRRLGVTAAVVPATSLDGPDPSTGPAQPVDVTLADGGVLRVLPADAEALQRLEAAEPPVLAAQHTLALLALRRDEAAATPQGTAMVVPPERIGTDVLDAFLGQLAGAAEPGATGRPVVLPASLREVLDTPPAQDRTGTTIQRRWDGPTPKGLGGYPTSLAAAHVSVEGYRSMVADLDSSRLAVLDRTLLVSGDRSLDEQGRQAFLDATTARVVAVVRDVQVPDAQAVTITAREAVIPITAQNDNDHPVRVRMQLQSEKLLFPDGDVVTAVLAPGANRLEARVRARASGAFPLDVRVTSPDEGIAIATGRVQVRSTAVSGVGLVLSIGAGVFLLVWWGRHLRRGRRQHRLVGEEPASAPER